MNSQSLASTVEVVEVAPRDGFQSIADPLGTERKIEVIQALIDAGIKRIEIGSFVSPKAIPQMADTGALVQHFKDVPGVRFSALVPNKRGAELALAAGVKELVYVVSVSETHNQKNVRQSVEQSLQGLQDIAQLVSESAAASGNAANCGEAGISSGVASLGDANNPKEAGIKPAMRLDLGTCFDCPYEGRIEAAQVAEVLKKALAITQPLNINLEVAFCDTTGKASPLQVGSYFAQWRSEFGADACTWGFHGHDTFGMGVANALFAVQNGATVLDASAAGLGGCPFAPGATGNTATEDLIYALNGGNYPTGINLPSLLQAADLIAALPGGKTASHLRTVPRARVA